MPLLISVRTLRLSIIKPFFVSLALLLSSAAFAQTKTIIISDFDGTLTNDRQVDNGTYQTNIVLFRVESQANILTPMAMGPTQVEITSQEFTRLRKYLAPDVSQQVTVHRSANLANGQKIKPGEYYFSPFYSYRYYLEATEPQRNYLLESQIKAEEAARRLEARAGAHWQGKMWPVFADYVANKRTDPNTHFMLLTARGHSVAEWLQWGHYLVESGELSPPQEARALPVVEGKFIHNVSRPEYTVFSFMKGRPPQNDITPRKIGYLRQFLIDLMRVEPNLGERHHVVFADNDQHTVKEAYALFQEFVFGGRLQADFTVINAGGASEIDEMGLPAIATMDGKTAVWKRTPQEILEKIGLQNYGRIRPVRKIERIMSCQTFFSVAGVAQ